MFTLFPVHRRPRRVSAPVWLLLAGLGLTLGLVGLRTIPPLLRIPAAASDDLDPPLDEPLELAAPLPPPEQSPEPEIAEPASPQASDGLDRLTRIPRRVRSSSEEVGREVVPTSIDSASEVALPEWAERGAKSITTRDSSNAKRLKHASADEVLNPFRAPPAEQSAYDELTKEKPRWAIGLGFGREGEAVAQNRSPKNQATPTPVTDLSEELPADSSLPGVSAFDSERVARLQAAGDEGALYLYLSECFWQAPADRAAFQEALDAAAGRRFFAPQPQFVEPYIVQPGDQLRKIAAKYHLTWQYLAKLNKVDPKKIRPGQKLKVAPGPFAVHVDLSDFDLVVHCQGQYVRRYKCGIGKDGTTPTGEFKVLNKLEDPTYYGPDGVIAASDPLNPLGERWIDLGDSYGIHGTIDPRSIGKSESRGCLRLLNSDAEEVYDLLTIGSVVKIQP